MRASPTVRQGASTLVFLFLVACGSGGKDDTSAPHPAPTPAASYAAAVPATAVVTLDASSSTATGGGTLTYAWQLTSAPTGSAAAIANPTAVQTTLTTDLPGAYVLNLTVNDGIKSQSVAFPINAYAAPTILTDLVEPVSGIVQLSLSVDQGTNSVVAWTANGGSLGSGATVSWDTSGAPDGPRVVVAKVNAISKYTFSTTRTIQATQTPVSFTSSSIVESAGKFTALVGAQSVNGILRVDATLDGVAFGTLAAPNACTDTTGAACVSTGPNGYSLPGTVGTGAHVVVVTVTDNTGRTLGIQLRLTVTDV